MAERQFHIQCTAEDIGHYVFLPGDPDRVPWIVEAVVHQIEDLHLGR